jgi:carboxyl-terminal processing protease
VLAKAVQATPTDVLGWRLDDVVALIRGKTLTPPSRSRSSPADAGPDGKPSLISLGRSESKC